MSLFGKVTEKSWETHGSGPEFSNDAFPGLPVARTALRVLMAVMFSVFALMSVAYVERMELADWSRVALPNLLWINTAVLVLASIAMQWARVTVAKPDGKHFKLAMLAGGVLTLVFLAGQWMAWQEMGSAGYFAYSNPYNAFFYLFTGLHAVHLLGGLFVWARAEIRFVTGAGLQAIRLSVELCSVYWHFLLLVWLVLFGLLLST